MKDWYTEKRVSRSIFGSILEYEYLYLNGELDIDCIYLKKRREHIGTYKVADMELCFRWMQNVFENIEKIRTSRSETVPPGEEACGMAC